MMTSKKTTEGLTTRPPAAIASKPVPTNVAGTPPKSAPHSGHPSMAAAVSPTDSTATTPHQRRLPRDWCNIEAMQPARMMAAAEKMPNATLPMP